MASCNVYMTSGGDELVVGSSGNLVVESGGYLTVESGGQVDIESGGHIDLESGGYISVASGGYITEPVQAVASTGTALINFGISYVSTTVLSSANHKHTMAAPAAGVRKTIVFSVQNSTKYRSVDCGSGVTVVGHSTETAARYVRFAQLAGKVTSIHLVGLSATKWAAIAKTTNITLTTSTA